ncbi:MAG: efflux RND transporter periplasmic adaptor subunit [Pararhizobium sp.]
MKTVGRIVVTLVLVAIAAVVAWNIWIYYEEAPRTRDGRVRADVVAVAADVAGRVIGVPVKDNQTVGKGDVLFKIDPARYQIALEQDQAALKNAEATRDQAERDAKRYAALGATASVQEREQAQTKALTAEAAYNQAKAAVDLDKLNLARTTVRAPVNGIVTNLTLRPGDYVTAGSPVLALVDSDSFYVVGYFEETKLSNIHVGDPAKIKLMGRDAVLKGHVTGISAAISDRDLTTTSQLLPDVNPSFTWVRLAQRVPVRIAFDGKPDIRLVAGRTASIEIGKAASD